MSKWYSITVVPSDDATVEQVEDALKESAGGITDPDKSPDVGVYGDREQDSKDEDPTIVGVTLFSSDVDMRIGLRTTESVELTRKLKRDLSDVARLLFVINANDNSDSASGQVFEYDDGWVEQKNEHTPPDGRGSIRHKLGYDGVKPLVR